MPSFNDHVGETISKHYAKRRKCWSLAFSHFLAIFSANSKKEQLICCLQMISVWFSPKFCPFVKNDNFNVSCTLRKEVRKHCS